MSTAHICCDGCTQALNQPGNTSCIKVIVERCEGLVPAGGSTLTIKPYVHYRWAGQQVQVTGTSPPQVAPPAFPYSK